VKTEIQNRRRSPRAKLSQQVRIRPANSCNPEETCATANVSRTGLYFQTTMSHYYTGMDVLVIRNYQPGEPVTREEVGDVIRVEKLDGGKWGIAIRIIRNSSAGLYAG
jgi:hypothetical protein